MNGVKDNETMPNVSLDCYLGRWRSSVRTRRNILYSHQNMLETEAHVSTFVIVARHMHLLGITAGSLDQYWIQATTKTTYMSSN